MNISARNIWPGTVTHIETGAVNDVVSVKLRGGAVVTSVITKNSVQRLGLKEGSQAMVVIKASSVMLGLDIQPAKISARNVLPGTVKAIEPGVVNDVVENKALKEAYAELALNHKCSEKVIEVADEMFNLDLKKKYEHELSVYLRRKSR